MPDQNGTADMKVKSVQTTFRILEHLKDTGGGRVSEIADEFDLSKSTIHRHLTTLTDIEYVVKDGDRYDVGFRFLEFGEYTKMRTDAYEMARNKVEELAAETDERAQFLVEEHGKSVFVHRATGQNAVLTDPGIGKRVPIHASAAGKAILANLPEQVVHEIIEQHGLEQLTEYTITERDELFAELDRTRERNFAVNNQEYIEGLRAVGVPVIVKTGQVFGALSVSGPTHRLKGDLIEADIPDRLLGTANELTLNIKYS